MKRPTLLLINSDSNWGSTGRITEQLGIMAQGAGWESHVVYGRCSNPSQLKTHCFASKLSVYEHYFEYRLFDNDGLASRHSTNKLIRYISELKPDLIHLHNIHDHWLNYELLFHYLSIIKIPVIWTLHDCWAYTGGCYHYTLSGCYKWKNKCFSCALRQKIIPICDRSQYHYLKKKELFSALENLTLVTVSHWLSNQVKDSFLNDKKVMAITNGVDLSKFKPIDNAVKVKYGIERKLLLLGVATSWTVQKGFDDYIALSSLIDTNTVIMMLGLTNRQIQSLPHNIIGLKKTNSVDELAELYSAADVVLNLSYEESFGLTTVEGLACGTPGVVYNCTASPELLSSETGVVVEPGDIYGLLEAINSITQKGKDYYKIACRKRASDYYDISNCFSKYIDLYNTYKQ